MMLGALVDAGLPVEQLEEDLSKLSIPNEYHLNVSTTQRGHLTATRLEVDIPNEDRSLSPSELLDGVASSSLEQQIKDQATAVLQTLLEAERRVHRATQDELHLHELGSVDTLIDIVGTVAGLRRLQVEKVYASPIAVGTEQPNRPRAYPVPAPATLELASMAGAPVTIREGVSHEMTTPTGAALLTTLATFQTPPQISLHRVGYGAGASNFPGVPNVTAVWLGDAQEVASEMVVLLETNLDDVQGIVLGYAQERLFESGALDVWFTPIQMKKNRPGVILSALVPASLQQEAVSIILQETPTLGIRVRQVDRQIARRETVVISSSFGDIRVKVKYLDGIPISAAPEYEDCRVAAMERGVPLQDLYQQVSGEARAKLLE